MGMAIDILQFVNGFFTWDQKIKIGILYLWWTYNACHSHGDWSIEKMKPWNDEKKKIQLIRDEFDDIILNTSALIELSSLWRLTPWKITC